MDRLLPSLIPVVGPVPTEIVALDVAMFDEVADYVEAVQAQAAYFSELFRDVEDITEVLLEEFGFEGNWFYRFSSLIPADIAEFAELWEEEELTSNQELFDVFADSVATEMGRNPKRYSKVPVADAIEHEKANYRIVPDPDGNGATFQRKEEVEAAPVRATTEVPDPWDPISED
jgi:hypothetical protein